MAHLQAGSGLQGLALPPPDTLPLRLGPWGPAQPSPTLHILGLGYGGLAPFPPNPAHWYWALRAQHFPCPVPPAGIEHWIQRLVLEVSHQYRVLAVGGVVAWLPLCQVSGPTRSPASQMIIPQAGSGPWTCD